MYLKVNTAGMAVNAVWISVAVSFLSAALLNLSYGVAFLLFLVLFALLWGCMLLRKQKYKIKIENGYLSVRRGILFVHFYEYALRHIVAINIFQTPLHKLGKSSITFVRTSGGTLFLDGLCKEDALLLEETVKKQKGI